MNDALDALDAAPSADTLARIRQLARQAQALEQEAKDLEERQKAKANELKNMLHKTLPEAMDDAGITELTLEAEGNNPAFSIKCGPFYRAHIAAEWPQVQREQAFKWLDDNGHGDLIKTVIAVEFSRDDRSQALTLKSQLESQGYVPVIEQSVHWATLTSWLKEQVENNPTQLPPLDVIGGTIGRVAKPKKER